MNMKVGLLALCSMIVVCAGCNKPAAPSVSPPETRWTAPEIRLPEHFNPSRKAALSSFEKTTIDAYRKVGARNPKWDHNAEAALRLWAYQMCDEGSVACGPEFKVLRAAIAQALKDGCDDPLVMYAAIRTDRISEDMLVREWPVTFYTQMIQGLASHAYPPMCQAMILERGAEAIWNIRSTQLTPTMKRRAKESARGQPYPSERRVVLNQRGAEIIWDTPETQLTPELKRQAMEWWNQAADKIAEVDIAETDRFPFYVSVEKMLDAFLKVTGDRKQGYDRIAAALEKNSSKKGIVPLVVRGSFYLAWAWDARGTGLADTVTESGWTLFSERLRIAREALEKAWSEDQTDESVCQEMINIAAGECGREEIELWFERGKKINPAYYQLYAAKLNFIKPQWYGSEDEMLTFGRECLKEGLWAEQIPFILVGAHDWLAEQSGAEISKYFSKPGVWEEIEPVYVDYLSRFPTNYGYKSAYAYHAALAGRWDIANRLLDELDTNVAPLGFKSVGGYRFYRDEIRSHNSPQRVAESH